MNRGVIYAVGAYLLWGVLPIYWKLLQEVPATQILAHRMTWSLLFVLLFALLRKQLAGIGQIIRNPKLMGVFFLAACLLTINWLTYIWGVNAGFIVETSLGYFINPLVNVVLGVILLRERLRPLQWLPVGLASVGVIYLTISYGSLPWIALVLAFSFGLYAYVKKRAPTDALKSLTMETGILFVPALIYLLYEQSQGSGAIGHYGLQVDILLVFTGLVTALPLLLFGLGARMIPLSVIGILQYIAPTLQFLIGVLIYNEPFTQARLIGFGIIWTALIIFSVEGVMAQRRNRIKTKQSASS